MQVVGVYNIILLRVPYSNNNDDDGVLKTQTAAAMTVIRQMADRARKQVSLGNTTRRRARYHRPPARPTTDIFVPAKRVEQHSTRRPTSLRDFSARARVRANR